MAYQISGNTATVDFSHLSGMDRNLDTDSFAREAAMPATRWRKILNLYPPEARTVYKKLNSRAEAAEAFAAAAFQRRSQPSCGAPAKRDC